MTPEQLSRHLTRAEQLRAESRWAEAAAEIRQVVAVRPHSELFAVMAGLLQQAGDLPGQRKALEHAVKLTPLSAAAANNLALLLEEEGRRDESRALFEKAHAADPGNGAIAENLERLLFETGKALSADPAQTAEALRFYETEIARHPQMAGLWLGLGNYWLAQCDIGKADTAFRQALALRPNEPDFLINCGVALDRLGRPLEALEYYQRAGALQPMPSQPLRWNRALCQLSLGRLREGFADYEARRETPDYRDRPGTRWTGAPFPGQTLLLHTEQGFGDSIQMIRYAARAKELSPDGTVLVACEPWLQRLFATAPGIDRVIGKEERAPYDFHAPLLSLPHLFQTDLDSIPHTVPYFALPPAPPRNEKLPLRIALVWSGNPKYLNDRRRSIPLALLDEAGQIPGIEWTSLQCGLAAGEASAHPWLRDRSGELTDFYETALRLQEADLVLTVDTAVAHLAGALARPTWLLLPAAADWRWMRDRADSPWYPTLRLFRQEREGDWPAVAARVIEALRKKVG